MAPLFFLSNINRGRREAGAGGVRVGGWDGIPAAAAAGGADAASNNEPGSHISAINKTGKQAWCDSSVL